jgi:hypothetical protein
MKSVYSARDEVDAEIVKNALVEAGIEAVVQGGSLSAVLGAIPVTPETLPSVWVRDDDEQRARIALGQLRPPDEARGEPWTCPGCGERIEPQFTACWNCGGARPATSDDVK